MPVMSSWPALLVSASLVSVGCSKDKAAPPGTPGAGSGSGAGSGTAPTSAEAAALHGAGAPAAAGEPRDGADGLKAWISAARAACDAKDFVRGKAMVVGAIPTKADLESVLYPSAPAGMIDRLLAIYASIPQSDEQAACLFAARPERTVVSVYSSTTEQLRAFEDGTDAFREFPDGAKDAADQALKPGRTFYEVVMTAPGEPDGTKYHMFFWDGHGWKMLGPLWRALH